MNRAGGAIDSSMESTVSKKEAAKKTRTSPRSTDRAKAVLAAGNAELVAAVEADLIGFGAIWIWADLSLIYLKGFSPLRTNRDSARKRKPGAPFAGLIASNHFARKKHFKAAIDSRLFRGNTVSLSGRKAALSWRPRRFG
jgi:hypothetical protein